MCYTTIVMVLNKKIKAIGLFSGGLDSVLATKLIIDQGIAVTVLGFNSPFLSVKNKSIIQASAEQLGVCFHIIDLKEDYLKIIKTPKYGYGSAINPCLDCRVFMLKKARIFMEQSGAHFIFTGEVLGQRPMSQHRRSLELTAMASGLMDLLLRPLSAKLLPITKPERERWVDRKKLLSISGRSRKKQLELAKKYRIATYSAPAGGCLLTEKKYAERLKDFWNYKKEINVREALLLKIGRYFTFKKYRIIVGRNQEENKKLLNLKSPNDYFFTCRDFSSPITLLIGDKTKENIQKAACLTARYSDASVGEKVVVEYGRNKLDKKCLFVDVGIIDNKCNMPPIGIGPMSRA